MNELQFKITKTSNHRLRVKDLSLLMDNFYIPEDKGSGPVSGFAVEGRFKYSESATATLVTRTSSKGIESIDLKIRDHSTKLDEVYLNMKKDGYHTITLMILPTKEWFERELAKDFNVLDYDPPVTIYYTDLHNIYKYTKEDGVMVVSLTDLLDLDTENCTLSKRSVRYFYTLYLIDCYMYYCKAIFNNDMYKCAGKEINLSEYAWKRDFIWMTINAIAFTLEKDPEDCEENDLFYEAQRILEILDYCGGMCKSINVNQKVYDCGCSKN